MVAKPTYEEIERLLKECSSELAITKEQLIESEEIRRSVFENSPDIILTIDQNANIQFINRTITGRPVDEVVGTNLYDYYPAEDRAVLEKVFRKVIQTGNAGSFEIPLTTPDSKKRIFDLQVRPTDFGGNRQNLLINARDISKRKMDEKILQESEKNLRNFIDTSVEGIYCYKIDPPLPTDISVEEMVEWAFRHLVLDVCNDVYARMHGFSFSTEILGLSFLDLVGGDKDVAGESIRAFFECGYAYSNNEICQVTKTGKPVWFRSNAVCIFEDGKVTRVWGAKIDITEQKQAEQSFKDTKAILQAAMDNSPAAIAIADAPSGKLNYVNRAGLALGGGTHEELINGVDIDNYVSSWKVLHFDGTLYKTDEVPLARAIRYGEKCSDEFIIRRGDDDDRIVWATAAPIFDDEGTVKFGIVVFLDITKRKQIEKSLKKAHSQLEKRVQERTTELEKKTLRMEEINIALKVLLRESGTVKEEIEENIRHNLKSSVLPYLDEVAAMLTDKELHSYIDVIKSNIDTITSSFSRSLSLDYQDLTPREIQIANFIHYGKTNKDIANLLKITPSAVDFHRRNLRKKLNLKGKKENLRSYLLKSIG